MNKIFALLGEIIVDNDKAIKAIKKTVDEADGSGEKLEKALKKIGKGAMQIGTVGAAAITAIGSAMFEVAENTREYRTEMGKLATAFTTNGHSAETATETYKALQSVLGETDQAVEAANHLALLCDNQEDLQKWTKICTGIYGTFGASLPIEGLTEAANETAKTGKVTGSLADALNWAGIQEDEFNKKLESCTSEEERQKLIMDELNVVYKDAATQYENTNKKVIESNKAHENLNAAIAGLGDAAEPAVTVVVNAISELAQACTPVVEALSDAVVALADNWQTLKQKMTDISATITVHQKSTSTAAASVGSSITEKTGSSFLGSLAEMYIKNTSVNPDSPLINWNAGGAIFQSPTIFDTRLGYQGVGEKGAEAVAPITELQGYVRSAVQDVVSNLNLQVRLDSGTLVGEIAPVMDRQLSIIASRKSRGVKK